ncbi:MAG: DUF3786 domain-containing protein [Peptostreptococcaceae bacterium]
MESNYKVAYDLEWEKLKQLEPLDVSKRLGVEYNSERKQFIVPFFKEDYILDFKEESIYRKVDNFIPSIDDSIMILNYLTFSIYEIKEDNNWVTLKDIPNGGVLFSPSFQNMSVKRLIQKFGEDIKQFEENALKLGGEEIKFGDKGYKFQVLPKVSICAVMWEGDEDFSPNASILFNPSIQYLMHIETVIGAGICVAGKLIEE